MKEISVSGSRGLSMIVTLCLSVLFGVAIALLFFSPNFSHLNIEKVCDNTPLGMTQEEVLNVIKTYARDFLPYMEKVRPESLPANIDEGWGLYAYIKTSDPPKTLIVGLFFRDGVLVSKMRFVIPREKSAEPKN